MDGRDDGFEGIFVNVFDGITVIAVVGVRQIDGYLLGSFDVGWKLGPLLRLLKADCKQMTTISSFKIK